MLPPTSPRLRDPAAVPYFLWDLRMTVEELRRTLREGEPEARDEVIVRLLREANTRDVWLFVDWAAIEEAWSRVEHRLGRARPIWRMLRERHADHVRNAAAA
jgi:hypothetical protein